MNKNGKIYIIASTIIFILLFPVFIVSAAVTVTTPNGGECLAINNPYTIKWTADESTDAAFYFTKSMSTSTPVLVIGEYILFRKKI